MREAQMAGAYLTRFLLFVSGCILLACSRQANAETCPTPFKKVGSQCYYIEEVKYTWEEARSFCQEKGRQVLLEADLAVISACDAHAKLWHYLLINYDVSDGFHLGGTDKGEEGSWYWIDETPMAMGVPFWRPGDPEGVGDQNCMGFFHTGYFIDRPCDRLTKSVCQIGVSSVRS